MLSWQKVEEKGFNVNSICEVIHENRSDILGKVLYDAVVSHQEELLYKDLGDRYSRERQEASFSCPMCLGRVFTRKGKRNRVFKSVIGKIHLSIVQVQCKCCGARFCPYKDLIGLAYKDRISKGLKERQMSLTCHVSYRKAKDFIEQCLGISISPRSVRKTIDEESDHIRSIPVTASGEVVYEDSTKVKAGPKDRGTSIHMAITAEPFGKISGRNRMKKRLMFLRTGDRHSIKKSLKDLNAEGIIHDGDMNLSDCAPKTQRCLWHLTHQLKHFLWLDGVKLADRKPYAEELIDILHQSPSTDIMKSRYRDFINKLDRNNFTRSCTHLKHAESQISISKENCFDYHTTSPVEREMREINRRADVGARWSVPGVENLLLVKTYNRLNEPLR